MANPSVRGILGVRGILPMLVWGVVLLLVVPVPTCGQTSAPTLTTASNTGSPTAAPTTAGPTESPTTAGPTATPTSPT
eukprot:1520556-Pyramimonas_sp.AAC.1